MCEAVEEPPLVAEVVPGTGCVVFAEAALCFDDSGGLGRRSCAGEIENRVAARNAFIREGMCVDPDLEHLVAVGGGKPIPRLGRAVEDGWAIDLEESPRRRARERAHRRPCPAERLPEHVTGALPGRVPTGDAQAHVLVQRECTVPQLDVPRNLPGNCIGPAPAECQTHPCTTLFRSRNDRHALEAVEDSEILLTVSKAAQPGDP